jgi:hypothetical protein
VDRDHLRDAKEFVQRRDARRIPDGQFVDDIPIASASVETCEPILP